MYLIKNIIIESETDTVTVEDGIRVSKSKYPFKPLAIQEYWGKTDIHLGSFADISRFPKIDENTFLLSYVSEYKVNDIGNNFKEFTFNVCSYKPERLKGYLVFIKPGLHMKTNGKKLFERCPDELVVLLKNNEYLEFNGIKVEVFNNSFYLHV